MKLTIQIAVDSAPYTMNVDSSSLDQKKYHTN